MIKKINQFNILVSSLVIFFPNLIFSLNRLTRLMIFGFLRFFFKIIFAQISYGATIIFTRTLTLAQLLLTLKPYIH